MKQRVAIATALAARPELLLLDEPTTALDVTVEAGILDLLAALRARRGLSLLLVSHNLGIVDRLCDRAAVLYAGRVVEDGPVAAVLRAPRHPYPRGLLAAMPRLDAPARWRRSRAACRTCARPTPAATSARAAPSLPPGATQPQALVEGAAPHAVPLPPARPAD